ncbi:hypothetical protein PPERSA_11831 [Pseudocohnilembus persalinus]|uniref:SMAD/FHA domain n=1 Tax=Pseudocohnilembus persalinus TaxID=266149 RepID=A0A0V0QJY8_PSEPJ|nr:hypothetical protein PPERSA_11831 [Pseudocohnilembus persalinus]|eukprot:KRX02491.1 hypothetical protein PPERSA_11831 [Pseudocohnilembus persalinus]
MNPLDILGRANEVAKFDENKCDEIKQIKKTLVQIEAYQRGVDQTLFDEHCKTLQQDLLEEVENTNQVLQQAGTTKSSLFQKLRSIFPNNILEQLKDQNSKLTNEFKPFKEYYEMLQQRNNAQQIVPQRPNEPTLVEPDNNNYQQTLVEPDEYDNSDNNGVKLKIQFKFCGEDTVQSLLKDYNISLVEDLNFTFKKIAMGQNLIYEFGRQKYEKLKGELPKIIGSISNVHLKVYINKKKEFEQKEHQQKEEQEEQKINNNDSNNKEKKQQPVFATVIDEPEEDDNNHNNEQKTEQLNQDYYEIEVENLSANGTYLYLNKDQDSINAFSWTKMAKQQKAILQDGDKFAISLNKKNVNDIYIAYQINIIQ